MTTLVIDYGVGNLGSVARSIEECGGTVLVSSNPRDLRHAHRLILPGVGAFADGMANLRAAGWDVEIVLAVKGTTLPVLGICLGMQLLADWSDEGGENQGLGLVPGRVVRLQPEAVSERVPHVGWNDVHPLGSQPLFHGIGDGVDFYFVHSFHFVPGDPGHIAARTPFCGNFVSAVASSNVYGVQFHPEKSSRAGRRLLQNFLSL